MAKNIKGLKNQGSVQRYIPYKPLSQYTSKDISKLTFREIRGLNPQALVNEQQKIAYYKNYIKGAKARYNKTLRETGGTSATKEWENAGMVSNLKGIRTLKEAHEAYKKAQNFIGNWTSTKSGAKEASKQVREKFNEDLSFIQTMNYRSMMEIVKSDFPELFNLADYKKSLDVIKQWSKSGMTEDTFRKRMTEWVNRLYEKKQKEDLEAFNEKMNEGWTTLE